MNDTSTDTQKKREHEEEEISSKDDNDDNDDEQRKREELLKKKEELKKQFDAEYDQAKESESNDNWFEMMKEEFEQRAKRNQMEFANLDPETRYQLEGYKPGTYVRYFSISLTLQLLLLFYHFTFHFIEYMKRFDKFFFFSSQY
jgi:ribosome biogenesis protein BMS1